MFGDSMLVEGELTLTPAAAYTVKGELSKEKSVVWLEDSAADPSGH